MLPTSPKGRLVMTSHVCDQPRIAKRRSAITRRSASGTTHDMRSCISSISSYWPVHARR